MDYFCSAFRDRKVVGPNDHSPAVGVLADSAAPRSIIGMAFPVGQVGGMRWDAPVTEDYPPPEVVWRLEIDRTWAEGKVGPRVKEVLEGRFVLRLGRFVELSEEAE